jgi:hypothetical protein
MIPLLLTQFAAAKYAPMSAPTMIREADVVVTGEIVALDDTTFTVRVGESLAGPAPGESLTVRRFEDWTCASRWLPYAVGQEVVLLLVEDADGLRILSAGGEGELRIMDDTVWVRPRLDGFPTTTPPTGHGHGSVVPLDDFLDAARVLRGCAAAGDPPGCGATERGDSPTHAALL